MNHLIRLFSRLKNDVPAYDAVFDTSTRSLPEADKWFLSKFVVNKLIPVVGIHPYPLDELLLMCSTLAYFKPDLILEWGTHLGKSARIFFEVQKYLKTRSKIHSIDLPLTENHIENIHDRKKRGFYVKGLPIELHVGDGITLSLKLLEEVKPRLPLFFLDGDHSFESVWKELVGIKEKAPRAVILTHDVFFQGNESGYNCDPYDALNKFTNQYQLPFYSTVLGLPGMGLTYW